MAVSARARLTNRARERKENAQLLMTRYVENPRRNPRQSASNVLPDEFSAIFPDVWWFPKWLKSLGE
jgi:hypothetical protein